MNPDSGQLTTGLIESLQSATAKRARVSKRGRKSTSCTQCHLRKQACDRNQPCRRCVQRGVAHLCDISNKGVSGETESLNEEHARAARPSHDKDHTTSHNGTAPASPKL